MKNKIRVVLMLLLAICIMAGCGQKDTRPVQEEDIKRDVEAIMSIAGLTEDEMEEEEEETSTVKNETPDVKTAAKEAIRKLQSAKTEEERETIVHEFTQKASRDKGNIVIARSSDDQKSKTNKTQESKSAKAAKTPELKRGEAPVIKEDSVDPGYNYADVETTSGSAASAPVKGETAKAADPFAGRELVWVVDKEFESEAGEFVYTYGDASQTWRLVENDTNSIIISDALEESFWAQAAEVSKEKFANARILKPGEPIILGAEWVITKELVPEEGHWEWIEN